MADHFNVGATVRLKSGGPVMTVGKIEAGRYNCKWFDEKKKEFEFLWFDESDLEVAKPTASGS